VIQVAIEREREPPLDVGAQRRSEGETAGPKLDDHFERPPCLAFYRSADAAKMT
jgi:hypothetical protein